MKCFFSNLLFNTVFFITIALVGLLALLNKAVAATGTSNATEFATINVLQNCQVSTSSINFGSYDPVVANASSPLNSKGIIRLACTKGSTGVTIALNYGINSGGTLSRYLNPEKTFSYNIFQPRANGTTCTRNRIWGNIAGVDTYSVSPPVSKAIRIFNVCAQIPGGQDVTAGIYSDTILVTVNF